MYDRHRIHGFYSTLVLPTSRDCRHMCPSYLFPTHWTLDSVVICAYVGPWYNVLKEGCPRGVPSIIIGLKYVFFLFSMSFIHRTGNSVRSTFHLKLGTRKNEVWVRQTKMMSYDLLIKSIFQTKWFFHLTLSFLTITQ